MAEENKKGLIRYTSRDYNTILEEFWNLVPKLTELWKPEADADPGVVLGKYLASIADMLGVNVDLLANELFAPSVTQRKNAEKIFGLIGYSLGWYTAARTEVTFTNASESSITLDFGFNGSNFSTLNAYTDITSQPRVITYNILPLTNSYGSTDSRSKRQIVADGTNVFAESDRVTLAAGASVTRVAIEGELRSVTVSVESVKQNNLIIKLPSQHIDTTAIWMRARTSLSSDSFLDTKWIQVPSTADFIDPAPRFAVVYDNYGNAQIQISNYLNQLDNYDNNYLTIYWIECSGVIGSVGADVLSNLQTAIPANQSSGVNVYDSDFLSISNMSNVVQLPHTYTVTGKGPETAKQAYHNSRNYINTWDSLITVPDFNRFIRREAGVDCGLVIDCQKALEINLAIYNNPNLTDVQKQKMYINRNDFAMADTDNYDWRSILNGVEMVNGAPPFPANFKTYTAMCYCIHNDFGDSMQYISSAYIDNDISGYMNQSKDAIAYVRYKAPQAFLDGINADFRPLQAMTVQMQFGYTRVFPWYVIGEIYPKNPVSRDVGAVIIAKVKEALALYFSPANRSYGQKPTVMEVVEVIEGADDRIRYFDAGSLSNPVINWGERRVSAAGSRMVSFDVDYFNPISFARYKDVGSSEGNIRISPEWITD